MSLPVVAALVRSLTFGGIVGMGVAWVIHTRYPHLIGGQLPGEYAVIYGGALGAALGRYIDAAGGFLFRPLLNEASFYWKLGKLSLLRRSGHISATTYSELVERLIVLEVIGVDIKEGQKRLGS